MTRWHAAAAITIVTPNPLAWHHARCCAQRIVKKAGKLKAEKIKLLDQREFDWDGATAL
jgi:hypothetical protein